MKETFTYIAPQSQLKKLKEKKEKPERKNLTSRQMKNDIKKFKKNIDEIALARKENRLSERYDHSVDYEDKASEDVEELEKKIHELERLINGEGEGKDEDEESILGSEDENNKLKESVDEKTETDLISADDPKEIKPKLDESEEEDKSKPAVPSDKIGETPEDSYIEKKRRKLGVVDTDLIEKRARDISAERMTADKASLKGVSGFFKKIWKHNWMGEYYRAKETDKIKAELMGAGSTFSEGDTGGVIDRRIKESILNRFLEDSTELIHSDAGEWKDTVEFQEKKDLAEARLREAIKTYATAIDSDQAALDFKAERDRIYADIFADKDGSFSALNVADNVFEFAKEIRGHVDHGKALSELDLDFELTVGGAKTGVRTEAHYNWIEKKTQQLSSTWVGRFFNETTIAAGVSAAMIMTKIGTGKGARAVMGLAGGMVLAGGVAGLRESAKMEDDRARHAIAMASGREFNPAEAPRRKELQEAMYEMISAKTATEDLHNLLYETVGGVERQRILTPGEIDQVLSSLSHIDSRIALSDKGKLDLLGYSDEAMIEVERTNLDLERYKAKIALKNAFAGNPSLGNFDARLQTLTSAREDEIKKGRGGIEERDATFKKIKRRHVVRAMATGALTGLTFGLVAQEVGSAWSGQQGVVEGFKGGTGQQVTSLEWAREKIWEALGMNSSSNGLGVETVINGQTVVNTSVIGGVVHEVHSTLNSTVKLPEGFELNASGTHPGTYEIIHEGKSVANNIEIDPKTGNLTPNSLSLLDKAGFHTNTSVSNVNHSVASGVAGSKAVNVQDFAHENADKFEKIKRLGWADNGTVRPDKNELKLWDPVEKNGQYEYVVKMNHTGSVFNGQHIDPVKLASEGKLKALFSLSHDSQGHPIEVPIKYEGGKMTFDVDPKDPILGQLFHKGPNGEIICDARYVEVGAEMGSTNGVKEFVMCATEEGKGVNTINTIGNPKIDDFIEKNVKTDIFVPRDPDVYLPPIIPLVPRTPLEPTKGKAPVVSPYYGYGYGEYGGGEKDIERWKKVKSPTLTKDPTAKLNQEKELELYFEQQKNDSEFGEEYLRKLDKRVEEKKLERLLNKDTKVVVCIAVHGVAEADNIYKTLELYAKQEADSLKKSAFVLNINWREFENKSTSIEKTLAEVERAKKDFPQLRIAYFTEEISLQLMLKTNNRIHSLIMKNLNDTVLRGIQKSNLKDDVYLISNDADCRGMSSKYLKDVIDTVEKEPEVDGFLGKIEWGSEVYNKYPGYHVSMRIMQYLDAVGRNRKSTREKYIASSGANFICKTSTFAAVGGYEPHVGAGADVGLGQKIRHARLSGAPADSRPFPLSYINSAWLDTDPQRGLGNYLAGLPISMMWNDFDKSGYKPRTELVIPAGSEESFEKFDDVVSRIEFQINGFINGWNNYGRLTSIKALNYLFPPQRGKPGWLNKSAGDNPEIVLTKEGKDWLKKQLEDYEAEGKADVKYNNGRGFRS